MTTNDPQGHGADCWNRIGVWGAGTCERLPDATHCHNCPVFSDGGRQLLHRPAPSQYLSEWSQALLTPPAVEDRGTVAVSVFRIGIEWFGLDVKLCSEVVDERPVHSLPHRTNDVFLGLVNVRGELKLCASLAHLLGIQTQAGDAVGHIAYRRMLVVDGTSGSWVFPCDEVHGVHRYRQADAQAPPVTVDKGPMPCVSGVIDWQSHAVGILDAGPLLARLQESIE